MGELVPVDAVLDPHLPVRRVPQVHPPPRPQEPPGSARLRRALLVLLSDSLPRGDNTPPLEADGGGGGPGEQGRGREARGWAFGLAAVAASLALSRAAALPPPPLACSAREVRRVGFTSFLNPSFH